MLLHDRTSMSGNVIVRVKMGEDLLQLSSSVPIRDVKKGERGQKTVSISPADKLMQNDYDLICFEISG